MQNAPFPVSPRISINGKIFFYDKSTAMSISPLIADLLSQNINIPILSVNIPTITTDLSGEDTEIICKIFKGKNVTINNYFSDNLLHFAEHFQIQRLVNEITEFKKNMSVFCSYPENCFEFGEMLALENLLFTELNESNIEKVVNTCLYFFSKMPLSCLVHFLLSICLNYNKNIFIDQYELFISLIQKLDKFISDTTSLFVEAAFKQFIYLNIKYCSKCHKYSRINILIKHIFEKKLHKLLPDIVKMQKFQIELCTFLKPYFVRLNDGFVQIRNEEKIKYNSIEAEYDLMDDILKVIIADDIDSFQKHLSSIPTNIIDDIIHSDLCPKKMTLIEFSAYFGSLKCFNSLINFKAKIRKNSLAYYAVVGGNNEIIHMCEKINCTFDYPCLMYSIVFHHHKITKWLVETKKLQISEDTLKLCVENFNIKAMIYFIKQKINIQNVILFSLQFNNFPLFKWAIAFQQKNRQEFNEKKKLSIRNGFFNWRLKNSGWPSSLHYACETNNIEFVKILIATQKIKINSTFKVILYILFHEV